MVKRALMVIVATLTSLQPTSVAPGSISKVDDPFIDRSTLELCQEVSRELEIWYHEGGISRDEIDRIVDRCFSTFVN